jgi:hydroxyacylglutathione hydrolase
MIHQIINKLFSTNTYVCVLENNNCILIDPGSDFEIIDDFISEFKYTPIAIFATHGHFDHIASVSKFQAKYGSKFYLHNKDLKTLKLSNFLMKMFGLDGKIEIPSVDVLIDENNSIFEIESFKVEFFNTPGHTSGSCVIQINTDLFTGDTLFYSDFSSLKIPNDNSKILAQSQQFIFENFGSDILIYPGHGDIGLLINLRKKLQINP